MTRLINNIFFTLFNKGLFNDGLICVSTSVNKRKLLKKYQDFQISKCVSNVVVTSSVSSHDVSFELFTVFFGFDLIFSLFSSF